MIKLNYPKFWSSRNILSLTLSTFSFLYLSLGWIRRIFTNPLRLPGFVICVGNISVGGTGKTQLVAWIAEQLTKTNYSFLIVTKGYKSNLKGARLIRQTDTAADVGDESILLFAYGTVLAAKSLRAALPIINDLKPQVIIFDDGMQNPGFIKDLMILAIDAGRNIGNGRIFPAGPLRQLPKTGVNEANIIVMIGNKSCQNTSLLNIISASNKPFFKCSIKLTNNIDLSKNYYAFTGIGDPNRFFDLLRQNKINITNTETFPDHHHYQTSEIDKLKQQAALESCSLITTKKDCVKINDLTNINCAEVVLEFDQEEELIKLIYEKIKAYY